MGRYDFTFDASEIVVQNWRGLEGNTFIGLFQKDGGYIGLGETSRAIINRDTELSAFFSATSFISDEIFKNIIFTFKFLDY